MLSCPESQGLLINGFSRELKEFEHIVRDIEAILPSPPWMEI